MFECTFDFFIKRVNEENFKAPLHSHTCFELAYYYDSAGFTIVDGKKHTYRAGEFTIIEPTKWHDDHSKKKTDIICIGFNYDEAEFALHSGVYSDKSGRIRRLLELLTDEMTSKLNHYAFVANIIVKQLLVEISRLMLPASPEAIKREHIQQVLNYIQQYFLTDINLKQLSAISNYSYHRFEHIFKEEMGISPKQYILQKKLTYAKQQLQETGVSITELSYACGFSSTSLFIKQFKAHFKITPLQYKKLYLKNYVDVDNAAEDSDR